MEDCVFCKLGSGEIQGLRICEDDEALAFMDISKDYVSPFNANKQKNIIGLYPGSEAVAFFAEKLDQAGRKYSKGSIRIPYSDDLPLDLIAEIAEWCRETGNHA